MLVARRRKHCCAPSIASGPDGQPFVCSVSCRAKVGVRIRLHEEPTSLALPVHSSPPFKLLTETSQGSTPTPAYSGFELGAEFQPPGSAVSTGGGALVGGLESRCIPKQGGGALPGRAPTHVSKTDGGGGLTCSSVAGGAPGGLLAGGWGLLVVPAPGAVDPAPRACPAPGWAAGEAGDPAPGVADPAPSVGSVCCGGGTTASVSSSASFCGAAATSDGALHSCDTTMRNCPSCFATSATTSSFTRCSNCFATSPETVCCMVSAIATEKARTPLKTSLVSTCSEPRAAAPRAALNEHCIAAANGQPI